MRPHLHHAHAEHVELESAFTVDASRVTFGPGSLREVGLRVARHLPDGGRVALFTDARLRRTEWYDDTMAALREQNLEVVVFDEVLVEPTDASMQAAVGFAREAKPDAFVSLGGGSVIDTAKLADLLSTHPGELIDYVNAPLGAATPVPGPLKPHVACPTTSGTGSEVTGIAIFDLVSAHAKTGVSSPLLRPTEAVVDPRTTASLPADVVASSGLDVLCHAVESLTARAYVGRPVASPVTARPASQGANPWSDLGARQAIELIGRYLRRAVADEHDEEARHQMMWAATLAGIAFGNAGVHVPHAMAYAVAGVLHDIGSDYRPAGYVGTESLVPHGFAVAVTAPAAFRALAPTTPFRHLEAARLLGGDTAGVGPREAGDVLAEAVGSLMHDVGAPNGIGGVGYTLDDVPALVAGAAPQRRLLDNAPSPVHEDELHAIFSDALRAW
ncbi:Alcohol dehydrogenase, class IV [Nocardioides terrae]|uniref:hydroxyacid-oxoacid transhydrogenase n=1 Tax=Nocardioides terrae TaxID=574651 RepID=A0A1I1F4G8_9ACTN|nr:hydroxyacid-oxoacid transhydrogenase [Nocardioides terrae]SFB92053.1 Alcohol dehydrogenase, class IV [Nocardioides terrae]